MPIPQRGSVLAAGFDLRARLDAPQEIPPGGRAFVPTGIAIALPEGFEAQIRPRSGLALKHGITFVNTPGTIDSDYRGVISLIVTNLGKETYIVKHGVRLAQMVIQEVVRAEIVETEELGETIRSGGGFGHTGI